MNTAKNTTQRRVKLSVTDVSTKSKQPIPVMQQLSISFMPVRADLATLPPSHSRRQKVVNRGALRSGGIYVCAGGLTFKFDKNLITL